MKIMYVIEEKHLQDEWMPVELFFADSINKALDEMFVRVVDIGARIGHQFDLDLCRVRPLRKTEDLRL